MTIEFSRTLPSSRRSLADLPKVRIASLVLLGGAIRPSDLSKTIDRSLLDLPIDANRSLLAHWISAAAELRLACQRQLLPVRLMFDRSTTRPTPSNSPAGISLSQENDPAEFRGTGGVLRDLCAQYEPDEFLVVANAAQVLFSPLPQLVSSLAATSADVSAVSHTDGSPVTLMLIRCGSMVDLPKMGFIDMKEQALSRLATLQSVSACTFDTNVACSIRTGDSYIHGLRILHSESPVEPGHLGEQWQSVFEIVEPGAVLGREVVVHDSVVLKGATVGERAVLVRSVIGPGANIPANATVVDSLVSDKGTFSLEEGA